MIRQRFLFLLILSISSACARKEIPATPARSAIAGVETEAATRTPTTLAHLTHRATSTPTLSTTATQALTSAPTATPTNIPRPTATPTAAMWVEAGTPLPDSGAAIGPNNATEITELARWGRGVITDIDLSADGRWLAVAAGPAVYIHDAANLSVPSLAITTTENVSDVSISPTGDRVALAVGREEMQLWQLEPLRLLFAKKKAWEPQFSPDGGVLAVMGAGGVEIWDSGNGEELASFSVTYSPKSRFSPSGERIAVWAGSSSVISIYDWREGRLVSEKEAAIHPEDDRYEEYSPLVSDVAFITEEDARLLVLELGAQTDRTGRIEVQHADDGALLFSADRIDYLTGVTKYVCNEPLIYLDPPEPPLPDHMEISADAQMAAIRYKSPRYKGDFGEYSSMRLYSTADGRLLYVVEEGIVDFELSPDGQSWVAGLQDGRLQVRRLSDGAVLQSVDAYESPALALSVSPDDHWVGVVYEDEVKVLRRENGVVEHRFPAEEIAFSPQGTSFALAYEDGRIEIRALADGSLTNSIMAHQERVTAIDFLPSGELLSAGFDCNISLWQLPDMTRLRSLENVMVTGAFTGEQVPVRVSDFLVMPDGQTVIGFFFPGDFGVWRVDDGQLIRGPDPDSLGVVVAVGPGGHSLAVSSSFVPESWDSSIVFVETTSSLASFSPDSGLLAALLFANGEQPGRLQLWQVSPPRLLHTAELGTFAFTAITFTHSGELLLTASLDGIVRLGGIP